MEYSSDHVADILSEVRRARGRNAKMAVLVRHPEVKKLVRLALHPYWHFNIKPTPAWQEDTGTDEFNDQTMILVQNLITGKLSGSEAKRRVKTHLKQLTYKSGQLLISILNKRLDIGMGAKSINEVWPGWVPIHAIQLAHLFDEKRVKFPCYQSAKIDGLRATFDGNTFRSRNGNEFKGLTKLARQVNAFYELVFGAPVFAAGVILDGELTVNGMHFNEISGSIRAFKESDNAVYNIFDVVSENPFHMRNGLLTIMEAKLTQSQFWNTLYGTQYIDTFPGIKIVSHYLVHNMDELMEYQAQFRRDGFEGSMVKSENGIYTDGRSYDWMKIKDTLTADCEVLSVFEGNGKYEGQAGGLVVNFNGVKVRVGGGMTDRQRAFWYDDPELVVGKIAEVAYQEKTPDGSMRHPRLVTIRGDL